MRDEHFRESAILQCFRQPAFEGTWPVLRFVFDREDHLLGCFQRVIARGIDGVVRVDATRRAELRYRTGACPAKPKLMRELAKTRLIRAKIAIAVESHPLTPVKSKTTIAGAPDAIMDLTRAKI